MKSFYSLLRYIKTKSATIELDISPECSLQGNLELVASFLGTTSDYLQLIK